MKRKKKKSLLKIKTFAWYKTKTKKKKKKERKRRRQLSWECREGQHREAWVLQSTESERGARDPPTEQQQQQAGALKCSGSKERRLSSGVTPWVQGCNLTLQHFSMQFSCALPFSVLRKRNLGTTIQMKSLRKSNSLPAEPQGKP